MAYCWNVLAQFWGWIAKDSISFFTFVLAIVAAFQGGFLWRQIKLGRDEFNATHRGQLEVKFVRDLGGSKGVEITVINTGSGKATLVSARAMKWYTIRAAPSPHEIPGQAEFSLKTNFRPSDSDRYAITYSGRGGDYDAVFGWIIYDTADGARRTTYFGRRRDYDREYFVEIDEADWNFIQ
jgi:hypothetical protein